MLNAIHELHKPANNQTHIKPDNRERPKDFVPDDGACTGFSNDPIAVRLYENQVYGTTYARGLYRRALYNGTIDLKTSGVKYLVDLYSGEDWANQAKSDEQMLIVHEVGTDAGYTYSWIRRYDAARGVKTPVLGFCRLDTQTLELRLLISDDDEGVQGTWCLQGKPCRAGRAGAKSPQILAANYDLG
jgi:hypothetical protein